MPHTTDYTTRDLQRLAYVTWIERACSRLRDRPPPSWLGQPRNADELTPRRITKKQIMSQI